MNEARLISRNTSLTTLPTLKAEWKVSFEFKANNFNAMGQLLHMTTGGQGTGAGSKYGDRTPAIWTHPTRGFLVTSAVNGKYSYAKWIKPLPTAGQWTTVEVKQEVEGTKTIYSITIGGKKVISVTNSKPTTFQNVKVFASSEWYTPLDGFMKNLLIQQKSNGKSLQLYVIHIF